MIPPRRRAQRHHLAVKACGISCMIWLFILLTPGPYSCIVNVCISDLFMLLVARSSCVDDDKKKILHYNAMPSCFAMLNKELLLMRTCYDMALFPGILNDSGGSEKCRTCIAVLNARQFRTCFAAGQRSMLTTIPGIAFGAFHQHIWVMGSPEPSGSLKLRKDGF